MKYYYIFHRSIYSVYLYCSFDVQSRQSDDLHSIMSKTDRHLTNIGGQKSIRAMHAQSSPSNYTNAVSKKQDIYSQTPPDYSHIMVQSVQHPAVLVGWRVDVPGYGTGIILSIQKKRFFPTHFQLQFDHDVGHMVQLPLQRSAKKGSVPFTLLKKMS